MTVRVCRWGILSTASIGRKNWQAIARSGNAAVVAVASRSTSSAQRFIDENQTRHPMDQTPRAFGDYAELLSDPNVDAVYLPLPTGLRKEWVIRAAEAGKHVLCEKPCALNADELAEMLAACRHHNVQFMDGVMYMHSHRLSALRHRLDDPQIVGEIKRIATQFSFNAPAEFFNNNIRVDANLEPQGCLGDLGWYALRFALWVMHGELPTVVRGRILSEVPSVSGGPTIPVEFSGELDFSDGVTASFYVSFITGHQQWGIVSGSRGVVQVNDYVLPFFGNTLEFESRIAEFNTTGWDFNMEVIKQRYTNPEFGNGHETAQETELFRHFSNLVVSGQREPHWAEWSWKTQLLLDACLTSGRQGGSAIEVAGQSLQFV